MKARQGRDNLPSEVDTFVGRRREIAELRRILSGARLVTLTGVGGVGKTRLAVRMAAQARRSYRHGVWLVELAGLHDPALLLQTVVDALGIGNRSSRHLQDVLTEHLSDKELLLLLDNCEHLLQPCARLARVLLLAAPALRILATSRQALGVDAEHVMVVPPLAVSEACGNEAVQLFMDRAAAIAPGFAVDAPGGAAIAQICQQLDGIPLAIELAAARLRVLSPAQVLARLDDCLGLLTGGSRAAPTRQQTLQAAIDWSYDLATKQERALWSRLSIFPSQFDLDAAESVCCGDGLQRDTILDLIHDLIDKSVLTRSDQEQRVLYRMLEPIRRYGQATLSSTERIQWLRRHSHYCQRLALQAEREWFSREQARWCTRLRALQSNLQQALDLSLSDPSETQRGLAMAASLCGYWVTSGLVGEGQHWLRRALNVAPDPTPARARALWVLGSLTQASGDLQGATAALQECHALAESLKYDGALAFARHYLGVCAMAEGDHDRALELYEHALSGHRKLGDEVGVAAVLYKLAFCYCLRADGERGDVEHALALAGECLRRCEEAGETWCRSRALYVIGLAHWMQGRHDEAEASTRDSVRLKEPFADAIGIGMGLDLLACIAASRHRYERTARLLGAAHRIWRETEAPLSGIGNLLTCRETAKSHGRHALGASVFDRIAEEGASLSLREAVSYAAGTNSAVASTASINTVGLASPLTPRERQVAAMIAAGMSNTEIAAKLVISRRTAESHVEHILAKLNCNNRAQIASWVSRHLVNDGTAHMKERDNPVMWI